MQKLNGETLDIVNTNIDKLKEIFPDVFSEGKIDFEALKSNLGEFIDQENERYSFSWNGKEQAKKIALTPSTGTLRPCKDESKHWETTENLYIEGDNLEVLKLLQKSYFEKIKMIYIDPPYNTGNKEFIYDDDFSDNIKNYLQKTGQIDSEGNKINTSLESNGRFHSDWLNMMYPRLKLARNLLKNDGVIFISIDDNEENNLTKLCDEIFGENNRLGKLVWKKKYTGGKHTSTFADYHEFILVYCKNIDFISEIEMERPDEEKAKFDLEDEYILERGKYYIRPLKSNLDPRPTLVYPIYLPDGNSITTQWIVAEDTFKRMVTENRILFKMKRDGEYQVYKKYYEKDGEGKVKIPSFLEISSNNDAKEELKKIFDIQQTRDLPFSTPKPLQLISFFIKNFSKRDDITLDFFSGSATTAHAVMDLNTQDEGNRKFIMVQLPELTDEKSEAYKAGYKNICEIGKARIDKAGDKIKKDFQEENNKLKLGEEPKEFKTDIGFKVFKLDSSNIKAWDSEYAKDNIQQSLLDSISNIKEDRNELDLLFELLLKQGLDLTTPIMEIKANGKVIYNIGAGALYVSLSDNITVDVAEKIIEENKIYNSPRVTVIFKDNGFKNDVDKTNVIQTLKVAGISDIKSI